MVLFDPSTNLTKSTKWDKALVVVVFVFLPYNINNINFFLVIMQLNLGGLHDYGIFRPNIFTYFKLYNI
jgi:hypothetical protein